MFDDDLDDEEDWLNKIEEEDKLYNDFYYEKNENININFVYISLNNSIQHIKSENFILQNNIIPKEELLYILKNNQTFDNKKYSLLSILQYNIDLLPQDVMHFLKKPNQFNFFNYKTNIDDIKWNDSISLFQDINSLYILFHQKKNKKNINGTKKIYITKKKYNKTKKHI